MKNKFKFLFLLPFIIGSIGVVKAQNEIKVLSIDNNYVSPNDISQIGTELTFQVNFYTISSAAKYDTLTFIVFPKNGIPKYIDFVYINKVTNNSNQFQFENVKTLNGTLNLTLETLDTFGNFKLRIFSLTPNDFCSLTIALNTHSSIKEYILRNIKLNGCL